MDLDLGQPVEEIVLLDRDGPPGNQLRIEQPESARKAEGVGS